MPQLSRERPARQPTAVVGRPAGGPRPRTPTRAPCRHPAGRAETTRRFSHPRPVREVLSGSPLRQRRAVGRTGSSRQLATRVSWIACRSAPAHVRDRQSRTRGVSVGINGGEALAVPTKCDGHHMSGQQIVAAIALETAPCRGLSTGRRHEDLRARAGGRSGPGMTRPATPHGHRQRRRCRTTDHGTPRRGVRAVKLLMRVGASGAPCPCATHTPVAELAVQGRRDEEVPALCEPEEGRGALTRNWRESIVRSPVPDADPWDRCPRGGS